ncbi:hypothetical protein KJ975_05110 [Myxococcota bacterium]|nr:hypothetical protein [Myxococcota bacterium]
MKAIIFFGLGLSVMLVACAGKGADKGPQPSVGPEMGAGSMTSPGTAPPVADMPPAADPKAQCDQLKAEYFAKLNAASGTCTTDADCTNVPGGIDDCGRVVDVTTARAVAPLFEKYVKLCGSNIDCAPEISIPRCRDGRCHSAQQ